jgi:hypothetical protein
VKPTVGRVVHFYGRDALRWQRGSSSEGNERFVGPFSATVVAVFADGRVNLRVDYPTPACEGGIDVLVQVTGEIVCDVQEVVVEGVALAAAQEALDARATALGCFWIWPPKV